MSNKRYYWLRLQSDFFRSKRIKKLRKMDNGNELTIIYLEMQLLSLQNEGILTYAGLEDTFEEELALDIDEDVELVRKTVNYLKKYELLIESDDKSYLMPYAQANIGSETASAKRMRALRERKRKKIAEEVEELKEEGKKESTTNVIKKNEKRKVVKFVPPTLDDVKEYCIKRKSPVDPVKFYDYFTEGEWIDSKGQKVKNWKQKLISWEGNGRSDAYSRPNPKKAPNYEEREYDYDELEKKYSRN